jgi:hypothetical protein
MDSQEGNGMKKIETTRKGQVYLNNPGSLESLKILLSRDVLPGSTRHCY